MSIQAGRVWPALPSKEDYKFEPNDPAMVAHDYRLLAREIECGRKDGTWPSSYRIPQKPWTPDGEVIAFEAVQVVLADLHHSVAVVHAGKIFAQSSPGHLFYCELARIAFYGYIGVHDFYRQSVESNNFTAIKDKERVDVVGACDCDGDGDGADEADGDGDCDIDGACEGEIAYDRGQPDDGFDKGVIDGFGERECVAKGVRVDEAVGDIRKKHRYTVIHFLCGFILFLCEFIPFFWSMCGFIPCGTKLGGFILLMCEFIPKSMNSHIEKYEFTLFWENV